MTQQQQMQYDASLMEMSAQQLSPAYAALNQPSLPSTPGKYVRPPAMVRKRSLIHNHFFHSEVARLSRVTHTCITKVRLVHSGFIHAH